MYFCAFANSPRCLPSLNTYIKWLNHTWIVLLINLSTYSMADG